MKLVDVIKLINVGLNTHMEYMEKFKEKIKLCCQEQILVLDNMKEIIRRNQ